MDDSILQTIIQGVGVGGTIVAVTYLLRPVFMKWLENIAEARRLEEKRITAERASDQELAQALNGVTTELKLSRGINNQLIEKIGILPTREDIQRVGTTMQGWGEAHDQRLARVHTDVKTIPDEMWRIGDPKLERLRQELEARVAALQTALEARISPAYENARQMIRDEFEAISARLSEIDATLQRFSPPPPEPGESKAPEESAHELETLPDKPESEDSTDGTVD